MPFQKEKPYGVYYNAALKKPGVNKTSAILVIGAIVAVVIGALLLLGSVLNQPGAEKDVDNFGARLSVLSSMADEARKSIQDRELNQINTNARLVFTADKNSISNILRERYQLSGITPEAIALQSDPTVKTRLDEAKLINKYDITYRAILEEKIAGAIQAGLRAKQASRSQSADEAIQTAVDNLRSVQKQLQDSSL